MKRNKVLALVVAMMLAVMALVSCGKDDTITIGVIQFGSHPSLDNCYEGLEKGLEEALAGVDYEIDLQNGNFDSASCDTIAKNMVASDYDMLIGIATPAAVSAYAAAANTDIPVIFCAVSDPVAAGLVDSMETAGGNCTGTADILDLEAQVEMILAMQPELKTIGVMYTTSEANSVSQLAKLKDIAASKNITIVEQGVQTAADIPQAAAKLCAEVDCLNNFTDNNVVNNLNVLLDHAGDNNIPIYGSEEEQVVNGCMASIGLDYIALGKVTGQMAADVLQGEDISKMAVQTITDTTPFINKGVMDSLNIALPDAYSNAVVVDG